MVQKYYAVKVGRKPGIYLSWDQCKEQVIQFSGAIYKSFPDQESAKSWLNTVNQEAEIDPTDLHPEDKINTDYAFVDGSYDEPSGQYSYGVLINISGKNYTLSGVGKDSSALRNITGEMMAVLEAIKFAKNHDVSDITIFHDYLGLSKWVSGEWKTSNFNTTNYVKQIHQAMQQGMKIKFIHVKGHTKVWGNEEVDKIAKTALGIKT